MPEEMNRRNPFVNLLPSLMPKTTEMWEAMRRAIRAPISAASNLWTKRQMEVGLRRASHRTHGRSATRTNLTVHEKHVRRRIRNLNRGRGPT